MRLCAIDTSTLTASAALVDLGDEGEPRVLAAGELPAGDVGQGERLVPLLDRLVLSLAGERAGDGGPAGPCAAAGPAAFFSTLDAIAVGAGPGSFTGLRIGLATAKGLAFALGRPLWLASSLAALAWELDRNLDHGDAPLLVPALDARRAELYVGAYRRGAGGVVAVAPERVLPPAALAGWLAELGDGPAVMIGDALTVHAAALATLPAHVVRRTDLRPTPSAVAVAAVAAAGARQDALAHGAPAYIRPSEAEVMYPDGVPGAWKRP